MGKGQKKLTTFICVKLQLRSVNKGVSLNPVNCGGSVLLYEETTKYLITVSSKTITLVTL